MTRLHLLLVVLVLVAAAGLALLLRPGEHELGDADGSTVDLVENVTWPVKWEDNETITFARSTGGTTTVRLDGTVVSTDPEGSQTEPEWARLDPDAVFGTWRSWDGGIYLVRTDEKCGPPLLPSPDGKLVACNHVITNRLDETNGSYGAVVRLD
jgi:hypothetical protein